MRRKRMHMPMCKPSLGLVAVVLGGMCRCRSGVVVRSVVCRFPGLCAEHMMYMRFVSACECVPTRERDQGGVVRQ